MDGTFIVGNNLGFYDSRYGFWLRDTANGRLYPKTLTDAVLIGNTTPTSTSELFETRLVTSYSIIPPDCNVPTFNYGSGTYVSIGAFFEFQVYSYRIVDGVTFYSATYSAVSGTDDSSTNSYTFTGSWTAVDNADGYIVVAITEYDTNWAGAYYLNTTNTSFTIDAGDISNNWTNESATLTPTSYDADKYLYSDPANSLVQTSMDFTALGTLLIGSETNTTTINGIPKAYIYTAGDVGLLVESALIQAKFRLTGTQKGFNLLMYPTGQGNMNAYDEATLSYLDLLLDGKEISLRTDNGTGFATRCFVSVLGLDVTGRSTASTYLSAGTYVRAGTQFVTGSETSNFDLTFSTSPAGTVTISPNSSPNNTTASTGLTVKAGSVLTGGTNNQAGGTLNLNAGLGKGTGTSDIILSTGKTLTSGNTIHTLTEVMRILGNGRVGIGTTAPDRQLEINAASGECLRLTYNDADGTASVYSDLLLDSVGTLTLVQNGETEITVHQEAGSEGIIDLNHQSRCRAYAESSQEIPDNTITLLVLNQENWDEQSEWDVTTYRFTALEAGYYDVKARCVIDPEFPGTADSYHYLCVYKNGALWSYGNQLQLAKKDLVLNCNTGLVLADQIYLAAEDYLEFYYYQNTGSTVVIVRGTEFTYAAIHKLS